MRKQKKAIGYIRVSTQEQVDIGQSLRRQEEAIKDYCRYKKVEVSFISDQGISGFKDSRPGYQELIKLCSQKKVDTVVVYELSRLSRSVRSTLAFVEDMVDRNGIEFVSLKEEIDTTTPMGAAFFRITAVFNQLYRDEISYKTKKAMHHKRDKGEYLGGKIPFGFNLKKNGELMKNMDEQDIISMIKKLRSEGKSLRAISGALEGEGVLTKTGLPTWHPQTIKSILQREIEIVAADSESEDLDKDLAEIIQDYGEVI